MLEEKRFYLTKKGLERVKKEYEDLKKLRISKIRGESLGFLLSEDLNQEYSFFSGEPNFLETRIAQLENVLENVELIKMPPKEKQNMVNLGATVTLEEGNGQIKEFMIVGTLETSPLQGKISFVSPVGKALLGHRIGDEIAISCSPKVIYKIKRIGYCCDREIC